MIVRREWPRFTVPDKARPMLENRECPCQKHSNALSETETGISTKRRDATAGLIIAFYGFLRFFLWFATGFEWSGEWLG